MMCFIITSVRNLDEFDLTFSQYGVWSLIIKYKIIQSVFKMPFLIYLSIEFTLLADHFKCLNLEREKKKIYFYFKLDISKNIYISI